VNLPLVIAATAYGALAGALLPGPAHRLAVEPEQPRRDACPNGHALAGVVPRCGTCSAWYGPDAGLTAAVTAVVCGLLAVASGARPVTAVWLLLAPAGVLVALVDVAVRRLPDVLTLPMAAAAAVLLGVASLLPRADGSWPRALLGALALAAFYLVQFLISPRLMGFGDVKLALPLGLALGWYGWAALVAGTLATWLLGALTTLPRLLRRPRTAATVPFGPFMLAGTALVVALWAARSPIGS
jgi:leader peptidase (prepilin peptidase) / N-methyltransferase